MKPILALYSVATHKSCTENASAPCVTTPEAIYSDLSSSIEIWRIPSSLLHMLD